MKLWITAAEIESVQIVRQSRIFERAKGYDLRTGLAQEVKVVFIIKAKGAVPRNADTHGWRFYRNIGRQDVRKVEATRERCQHVEIQLSFGKETASASLCRSKSSGLLSSSALGDLVCLSGMAILSSRGSQPRTVSGMKT